jgi:hypothetical protein
LRVTRTQKKIGIGRLGLRELPITKPQIRNTQTPKINTQADPT